MAIKSLNTSSFSDVELAAKAAAETVGDLKALLSSSKVAATRNWVGDGREAFNNLFYVVDQQMKDISEEFWAMYDALVEIEGTYIEADQAIATEINTAASEAMAAPQK